MELFPVNIKLAWKTKQKQQELTKNQLFFISLVFFLKIQGIRKSETPNFESGQHKKFLGQVLTIFQTGPCVKELISWQFFTISIETEASNGKFCLVFFICCPRATLNHCRGIIHTHLMLILITFYFYSKLTQTAPRIS